MERRQKGWLLLGVNSTRRVEGEVEVWERRGMTCRELKSEQ